MIERRAAIGLSLFSALLVCAFVAQSASATLSVTTSKRITAVTCAPNGGDRDFSKAHCDPEDTVADGTGEFGHVPIEGETKEVDGSNENVTPNAAKEPTKEHEPAVLKGEVALTKTEISCTKVQNDLSKSFLKNGQPGLGEHTLSGTARTEFSNCTVIKPLKCKVKEPIISEATVHAVEGLVGPKGEKNAMGLLFVGEGEEKTYAVITFEGAECSLKGKSFKVKGEVIGTGGPTTESTQEDEESGATIVFTPNFGMEDLKFGVATAEFTSIVTARMGRTGNAIATTTTPNP